MKYFQMNHLIGLNKMKIVTFFVMDITLTGGIERVTINLSNELSKSVKVNIISIFKTNESIHYSFNKNINIIYLNKNKSFLYSNYKIYSTISILKNFRQINKLNSSIIVSQYPFISILLALLPFYDNKKIIASEHSEFYTQSRYIQFLRKQTYNSLRKVVTLTNSGYENFKKINIHSIVIPNPITQFDISKQPNFNNRNFTCLFVGRFEPVKQVYNYLEISKKTFQKDNTINFSMLGEGPQFNEFNEIHSRFSTKTNLKLFGNVKDIENEYAKSNILICTSISEAYPMVVIEALSFGCVVIGYDSQIGTKEIIKDDYNGFIVPFNDIRSVIDKIIYLKTNPEVYNQMSFNAKKSVLVNNIKNISQKWIDLI